MSDTSSDALTLRDVAKTCNVSYAQAAYAVREYDIEPRRRIGIIRLWNRDDVPRIQSALNRIAERRGYCNV